MRLLKDGASFYEKERNEEKMSKTLYFEGAGMFGTGEPVGNCRLRTAFTNDNGTRYYLELLGNRYSKEQRKHVDPEGVFKDDERIGYVDFCHEITSDPEIDDCNNSRHRIERNCHFKWTLDGIRELVNNELNCSFDQVVVAPKFSGYQVFNPKAKFHRTDNDYIFGDEFVLDEIQTAKVEAIYQREYQRQKDLGEKYPCVSVYREADDSNLIHVRHFKKQGLESFSERID